MNRIKYRYKAPTLIDAIQFTGTNVEQIIEWLALVDHHKASRVNSDVTKGTLQVHTQSGVTLVYDKTDWVIVRSDGTVNHAKHHTFCEIYTPDEVAK